MRGVGAGTGVTQRSLSRCRPDATPDDPTARTPRRGPAARHLAARRAPRPRGVRVRRLARRRRAVVVAGAAADPARPPRLALREPLGLRGLARPAGPARGRASRRPTRPTSASATPTGSTTGPASPAAGALSRPGALRPRVGRAARYAADRGVRIMGDLPFYVAPRGADVRAHPGLFRDDLVAGRPAGRLHRRRASSGATRPTTGAAMRAEDYALVDRAPRAAPATCTTPSASTTSGPSCPGGACRRGARTARGGRWLRGPGRGGDRGRPRGGSAAAAAGGRGPGRHHRAGPPPDRRLGLPGMRVSSSPSPAGPRNPHLPENHPARSVAYAGTHDNDTARGLVGRGRRRARRAAMTAAAARRGRRAASRPHRLLMRMTLGVAGGPRDRDRPGPPRARRRGPAEHPGTGARQLVVAPAPRPAHPRPRRLAGRGDRGRGPAPPPRSGARRGRRRRPSAGPTRRRRPGASASSTYSSTACRLTIEPV